ncbi:hypothetical protein L3i22_006100 [Actinoplanes sp. L3-i22]|nr:hypothetical protein L3i22_006100 [Actinoplanes sp. L3-i22]
MDSHAHLSRSARIGRCVAPTRRRTLPVAQPVWHDQGALQRDPSPTEERDMFSRKLSRLAGLVFVLVAAIGGIGAAAAAGDAGSTDTSAVSYQTQEWTWN